VAVLFNILHDLICMAGGASKLSIDFVSKNWAKVGDAIIASPPRGGSKGYQTEVTSKVLADMFGTNAEQQVRTHLASICEQLKADGGLV